MKTHNSHVSIEGVFGLVVDVEHIRPSEIPLIRDMAWRHSPRGTSSNLTSFSATFVWEDDAERFAAEVVAYTDQIDWLESLSEEEAAELSLVL